MAPHIRRPVGETKSVWCNGSEAQFKFAHQVDFHHVWRHAKDPERVVSNDLACFPVMFVDGQNGP